MSGAIFGNSSARWNLRAVFASCVLLLCTAYGVAAITASQRQQVDRLQSKIAEAGKLYAAGKFSQSAERIREIQAELVGLIRSETAGDAKSNETKAGDIATTPSKTKANETDPALIRLVKPLYSSLQRAHGLLELEGVELQSLPTWEELSTNSPTNSGSTSSNTVGFANDIAPLLISKCGACHIDNNRGRFAMATYSDLMRGNDGGIVVRAGSAQGSRLVEVIESGDMPRGNGKVLPEELAKLKQWIDAGAKFDGPSPGAAIKSYAKIVASGNAAMPPLELAASTGKEIVKFSRDIAPILLDNCIGCHITSVQISGQLRLDSINDLLRGGGSGPAIVKGKPNESLLIKKLKGESGQRMPAGGRPPVSADKLNLISTWILEGATYDGDNPNLHLNMLIAQSWAATASHAELLAKREERALAAWRKILPNHEPTIQRNSELVMLGNVQETRLAEVFKNAETTLAETKRITKVATKEALVRGGLVLFVFKGNYEYSEHGRMNEQRQLPSSWRGHWSVSPLDVYGAIVDISSSEPKQQSSLMLQVVSGAYVGSLPQVPLWYAEGVARNLSATAAGRSDPRMLAWQQSMPIAVQKVERADILLKGQLDEESAGLVGMNITRFLMDRANRKRFDLSLKLLRDGQAFPHALAATFAPPEQLVKNWLGKK